MPRALPAPVVTFRGYTRVLSVSVPPGLRFDTPRQNQGQIVTLSFAATRTRRGEHGPGDEWRHSFDASDGESYYSQLTVEVNMNRRLGGFTEFRVLTGTGKIQGWDALNGRWAVYLPSPRARKSIMAAAGL